MTAGLPTRGDLESIFSLLNRTAEVTITDAKGVIRYVNDRFVEVSGFSREELIGNSHSLSKSGYHTEEFYADLWRTIKDGDVWHGLVCNRRKDGALYWADTTIMPFLSEGEISEYVAIRHDISEQVELREKYRVSSRHQQLMNRLLEVATVEEDFVVLLRYALEITLSAPFATQMSKGGIFLVDKESGGLRLARHKNLGEAVRKGCSRVAPGSCLCGRALETGETIFKSCIDQDHDIVYEGMEPHGHYNVPIKHDDSVLGVIVVYVPEGYLFNEIEEAFLKDVANTLALAIQRSLFQVDLLEAQREAGTLDANLFSAAP